MSEISWGERRIVPAADGRRIVTYAHGEPGRPLVLVHHGTPSSGILTQSWADDAERLGVRLVGYSRPGYDDSTRSAGRTVAAAATDAAAVADAEGAERFVNWGVSGGGPHALACAALLPDRVARTAVVAGVAPYQGEGLDWMAGMGEDNVVEFGAAVQGAEALEPLLEEYAASMTESGVEEMIAAMASLLPAVDIAALRAGLGEHAHDASSVGLGSGVEGWLDDDLAFVEPWGFDLSAIEVPVLLVQGSEDLMVPAAHGEWLGRRVAGAELRRAPGQGHMSLLAHLDAVYDWLL